MRFSQFLPYVLWALPILAGNFYLVSSTQKKMEAYHSHPPFLYGAWSSEKEIPNLLDGNPNTFWKRTENPNQDFDFFLEMKLSHYWDGSAFSPFPISGWEIHACPGKTLPAFKGNILLREAINVDKELRLPEDEILSSFEDTTGKSEHFLIPMPKTKVWERVEEYPKGIYIYTITVKFLQELSANDCISEITTKETHL